MSILRKHAEETKRRWSEMEKTMTSDEISRLDPLYAPSPKNDLRIKFLQILHQAFQEFEVNSKGSEVLCGGDDHIAVVLNHPSITGHVYIAIYKRHNNNFTHSVRRYGTNYHNTQNLTYYEAQQKLGYCVQDSNYVVLISYTKNKTETILYDRNSSEKYLRRQVKSKSTGFPIGENMARRN